MGGAPSLPPDMLSKGMPITGRHKIDSKDFERYFTKNISLLDTLANLEKCVLFFECLGIAHLLPQDEQIRIDKESIFISFVEHEHGFSAIEALPEFPFKGIPEECLSVLLKTDAKDLSQLVIVGLFVFATEYPKNLDQIFPLYIKILEHWEPVVKGFAASAICWLIQILRERFNICIGERWVWVINELLSESLLHYYDSLDVLRPASLLFLEINREDPSILVERFLNTIYVGCDRYKSTESWMIHLILGQLENSKIATKIILLHWPSWVLFFSRMSSNTPAIYGAEHMAALQILEIIIRTPDIARFFKANPKETTRVISWLMIWNLNAKGLRKEISLLLQKLMEVSALNQQLLFEEIGKIHPSLCQKLSELL